MSPILLKKAKLLERSQWVHLVGVKMSVVQRGSKYLSAVSSARKFVFSDIGNDKLYILMKKCVH